MNAVLIVVALLLVGSAISGWRGRRQKLIATYERPTLSDASIDKRLSSHAQAVAFNPRRGKHVLRGRGVILGEIECQL